MKKFANKIIVSDLDGTFLGEHEEVVQRNVEAIEYFKRNGGYFTVATGRVAMHVSGAIPCIAELINIPAVTCNGACLFDFRTGKVVASYPIDHDSIMALVTFVKQNFPDVGVRASSPNYCFVTSKDDIKNPLIAKEFEKYIDCDNYINEYETWSDATIFKVVLRLDSERVKEVTAAIREHFGDKFAVTQSWPTIIDIQLGGINKASSLEKYVRTTIGDGVKMYACGDYINDIEMLTAADVAVCPSNAHESVKKIADVCLCSNAQGLIADLVEYIEKNDCN